MRVDITNILGWHGKGIQVFLNERKHRNELNKILAFLSISKEALRCFLTGALSKVCNTETSINFSNQITYSGS